MISLVETRSGGGVIAADTNPPMGWVGVFGYKIMLVPGTNLGGAIFV